MLKYIEPNLEAYGNLVKLGDSFAMLQLEKLGGILGANCKCLVDMGLGQDPVLANQCTWTK